MLHSARFSRFKQEKILHKGEAEEIIEDGKREVPPTSTKTSDASTNTGMFVYLDVTFLVFTL
jgi:hypothetical protein